MRSPSPPSTSQQVKPRRASSSGATSGGNTSSYGSSMPSLFFQSGYTSQGKSRPSSKLFEATGEGLREAVKAADAAAVKDLLARVGFSASLFLHCFIIGPASRSTLDEL